MSLIESLPPLRDIIAAHNLKAEKKLGQNFLLDLNLTDKIARAAGNLDNHTIFEIGPGPGGLSRSLLTSHAAKVKAIEYDMRAVSALESLVNAAEGRFDVQHQDALQADIQTLSEAPRAIVANLPYNIATPLLIRWLFDIYRDEKAYTSMTLMFQKEVVERIVAKPNTKNYGRLAIICQWLCQVEKKFDVPASAFTPPPKITSSIVHFVPRYFSRKQPTFDTVQEITAAAFGQRRKMVRTSLKAYEMYFNELEIEETKRAENLEVSDFIRMAYLHDKYHGRI